MNKAVVYFKQCCMLSSFLCFTRGMQPFAIDEDYIGNSAVDSEMKLAESS